MRQVTLGVYMRVFEAASQRPTVVALAVREAELVGWVLNVVVELGRARGVVLHLVAARDPVLVVHDGVACSGRQRAMRWLITNVG